MDSRSGYALLRDHKTSRNQKFSCHLLGLIESHPVLELNEPFPRGWESA